MKSEWFASWFDSPYYPILYRHRDYVEAESFILALLRHLRPTSSAHFLDLACGRGRHAQFLNAQGFRVTGLDLSPESIADAKRRPQEKLEFAVHDMRDPLPTAYDYILNLFTSFGYFDDPADNLHVLQNVRSALQPSGIFVLDYMNVPRILANLVHEEEKTLKGIRFAIRRSLDGGFIVKDIHVEDKGRKFDFQERVAALSREDFESLITAADMEILEVWGDYNGNAWDAKSSPRIIFFCRATSEPGLG